MILRKPIKKVFKAMHKPNFLLPSEPLDDFCRRWMIEEVALFGSILRDDFKPESDVDLLVSFAPEARWGLLEHARMEQELAQLVGRKIDLFTKRSIEQSRNWIRRQEILNTAEVVYES